MDLRRLTTAKRFHAANRTDPARAASLLSSLWPSWPASRPRRLPLDREQSFDSIRKYTLEEAYEVFDAIERRDFPASH